MPHEWIERSRLWLVLDRDAAKPRSLPEATQLCIEGGVDVVVFRMKDATVEEASPIAFRVCELCWEDDVDIPFVVVHFEELIFGGDALHIGIADEPVAQLRARLHPAHALGYSAHSIEEARKAIADGADYVFIGPIFDTPSKRQYGPPLGVDVIPQAEELEAPVVYIGGMNAQTIPVAVAAGAKRVAAISALLSVPDPRAAARELKALLP